MTGSVAALDGQALVAQFASGQTTPVAVLHACLAQVEAHDARLGIVNDLVPFAEMQAAAQAATERWQRGQPASELDGVPLLVKGNIAIDGLPWHGGIRAFKDRLATKDADAVRVLRNAGLVAMGTVNMHEGALGETSINPAFRATRNPHAASHIAGGSSGGSAAAIAAGFAVVALGTDDMGSVRLPSAFCGVVGLKLAHGAVPVDGVMPLSPSLDHVGFHTRSVADARTLAALFGTLDPAQEATPVTAYRWRLADSLEVAPAVNGAMDAALTGFGTLGELDWTDVDLSQVRRAGLLRCERDAGAFFAEQLAASPEGFSQGFRALVDWGLSQDQEKASRSDRLLERITARFRRELTGAVVVSPSSTHLAPECDGDIPPTLADLTAPAAIAGLPAIAVPVGFSDSHLPLSVHIAGESLAAVLEVAEQVCPSAVAIARDCRP